MLPPDFRGAPTVLAMGGEMKSSLCLLQGGEASIDFVSGSLEEADVLRSYQFNFKLLSNMVHPTAIAIDMHPDYHASHLGRETGAEQSIQLIEVQHHHAHIVACMAEHALPIDATVLGIALDGLGYGLDNQLWGGEFLKTGYGYFERLGSFASIPMPGGSKAAREPWRNTLAYLHACNWDTIVSRFADTDIVRSLQAKPLATLFAMLDRGINSPAASSAGRLFDAVAGALGIRGERIEHEAQAAIQLEKLAASVWEQEQTAYPFELIPDGDLMRINWQAMWPVLLADLHKGMAESRIAARFHRSLADAVTTLADKLCHAHDLSTVAISGGVFQNRLLRETVTASLREAGRNVLVPDRVPAHDGGLAFGQACVAAARLT